MTRENLFPNGDDFKDKIFLEIRDNEQNELLKNAFELLFKQQKDDNNLNVDEVKGFGKANDGQCLQRLSELRLIGIFSHIAKASKKFQIEKPKRNGAPDICLSLDTGTKIYIEVKHLPAERENKKACKPIDGSRLEDDNGNVIGTMNCVGFVDLYGNEFFQEPRDVAVIRIPQLKLAVTSVIDTIMRKSNGQYHGWELESNAPLIIAINISELQSEYCTTSKILYTHLKREIEDIFTTNEKLRKGNGIIIETDLFKRYPEISGVLISDQFVPYLPEELTNTSGDDDKLKWLISAEDYTLIISNKNNDAKNKLDEAFINVLRTYGLNIN